jgi:methylated-DNA-[protein]-cysteine S-methyltransferase
MSYLTVPSPLGDLTLFEDQDALVALEWGRVTGGAETPLLARVRDQLDQYFAGRRQHFDLPLAPDGTAFQKKVWEAIRRIPFGKTASYGAIAHDVDSAPRAVGGACGRNPIPIIVPCHRVLGSGGAIGGYSGLDGLETKRFLLSLEGYQAS